MQTEDYEFLYELEESFWWFAGMRDITAALLDGNARKYTPQPRLILDAGCGTGGNLAWLKRYTSAAQSAHIVGIDYVQTALDFCLQRTPDQFLAQASATDLPFADQIFDMVTSFDVLVQLPGAGADEQAMREMYRVLRAGGLSFVRVAAYDWMRSGHDEALQTYYRYSLDEVTDKMKRVGFQILRATYANSFLLPLAVLRRRVLKPMGLADEGSDVKPLPPRLSALDRAFTKVLKAEANLLKRNGARLPAGLSAICVALKPR